MKIDYIKLFLIFNLLILAGCRLQVVKEETSLKPGQSIEEGIADHVVPLADNNSFACLDEVVKDKRLIILGEAGHWDGTTLETKTNVVKYLMEKHGFNIVGQEGLSFLKEYVATESENTGGRKLNNRKKFPSESDVKQRRHLVYLTHNREIPVLGIDTDACSSIMELKHFFSRYNLEKELWVNWNALEENCKKTIELVHVYYDVPFPLDTAAIQYSLQSINKIKNWVEKQSKMNNEADREYFEAILQGIRSIKTDLRAALTKQNKECTQEDMVRLSVINSYRDAQMASNIIWYMEHHPREKVIISCANFHGAKDISQCIYPSDSLMYFKQKLMGEHLAERFGDQMYSLAFTSFLWDGDDQYAGLLEQELGKRDLSFGFIDFAALRYQEAFFNKPFNCSAIRRKDGNWMNIWDGLYFIRDQKSLKVP